MVWVPVRTWVLSTPACSCLLQRLDWCEGVRSMRKLFGFATLLLAVLFTIPCASEGQHKKVTKKNDVVVEDATPQDYAALGKIKDIVGKIAAIDVKAGTMTFTLEWQTWEL